MFLFIPYLWKNPLHVLQCLNTSHVLIYRWSGQKPKFIWLGLNTSHVLIYLNTWKQEKQVSASLNTSHVLIYLDKTVEFTRIPRGFKYISCSYLSRQSGTVGRRERSLNTSHVLIYRALVKCDGCFSCGLNTSHVLIYRRSKNLWQGGLNDV